MIKLFKLVGEITVEGAKRLEKDLKSLEGQARKALKPVVNFSRQAEKTGKQLTMLTAPVIALGTAAVASSVKIGNMADRLLDLEQITGLTTDSIQEWEHVARIAGVSADRMLDVITKLSGKMPEIRRGTGDTADAIETLGVSIFDASGNARNMNELFPEIVKALQDIGNITDRNALSQKVFGKSLKDIAPILGLTANEIKNARTEAHTLGAVINKESIISANNFRIETEKLKAQLSGLGISLAIDVLPIVKTGINLFKERAIPVFQKVVSVIKDITTWFDSLPKSIKETTLTITAIAVAIGPLLIVGGKLLVLLQGLPAIIGAVRIAVLALNGVLLTNPFVAVAAVVATLTIGIISLNKEYKNLNKTIDDNRKRFKDDIELKQMQMKKGLLEELIYNYDKIANMEIEAIDPQVYKVAKTNIDNLEKSLGDMGVSLEGSVISKWLKADEILNGLNGTTIKNTEITTTNTVARKENNSDLEEKIKLLEQEIVAEEELQGVISEIDQKLQDEKKAELELLKQKSIEYDRTQQQINDNYIQSSDERIELLKREKEKEIEIAKAYGANVVNVEKYWNNEIQKIRDEESAKHFESYQQKAETITNYTQQAIGVLSGFYNNQSILIDNNYKKEKKSIENSKLKEEEKKKALEGLDAKYDKKKIALQKKQMLAEKASALFSIGINVSEAITKALAKTINPIFAGVIGALGLAQAAIVASKPLPELADGGVIKKRTGGQMVLAAEAGEDEGFIPMKKGTASIAEAIIANMKRLPMAVSGAISDINGQSAGVPSGNMHVSAIYADNVSIAPSGATSLERGLRVVRTREDNRLGIA